MTRTETAPAPRSRLRRALDQAPDAARTATQVIVDNPAPIAVTAAGMIVVSKMLMRAVRPRGLVEGVATMIVANVLCAWGGSELIERGYLKFRFRGDDGNFLPEIAENNSQQGERSGKGRRVHAPSPAGRPEPF